MPSPDIDTHFVERLAELLQRSGLTEIEISQGETRVRVVRQLPRAEPQPAVAASDPVVADTPLPAAMEEPAHPGAVLSPMVGTAYLSAEPSAAPFVQVGDVVKEGQTLLIIEAMKVMNTIRAPKPGRVVRITVENATPVEYGEPLMIIE
jgi:acetyl-CoA carboxylase biotin carboxyl carrier protein